MFSFLKKSAADGSSAGSKPWIILLGAVLGVALLLYGGKSSLSQSAPDTASSQTRQTEIAEYQAYLEKRVKSLCESVDGVGSVSAIVTLSGGFEAVYATENAGNGEDYVILGNGKEASGLLLLQKTPQIVGIGVVCIGADTVAVRTELISLLSASFHVPTNRIYITQAKK